MRGKLKRIENLLLKEILMTLFEMVEAVQADVATLKAAPAGVDNSAEIKAVSDKLEALAALVGTPATAA